MKARFLRKLPFFCGELGRLALMLMLLGILGNFEARALPPTISIITDRFVTEDTPTEAIEFTIEDAETPASQLRLAALSSNTVLVPVENISIAGTGSQRTVTIMPALNQVGVTQITIAILDGENLSAATTFQLKVFNANDAPAIVVPNKNITSEASKLVTIPFLVDDPDGTSNLIVIGSSSNQILVNDANIFFGGLGNERSVILNLSAGVTGTSRVTLTVADSGGLTASDTFDITVTGVQQQPPKIVGDPQGLTVSAGSPVTFSVNATGQAPLAYQWQFNGANIPLANGPTLTLPNVSTLNAGSYRVVVGNQLGVVTSAEAILSVQTPPVILAQPQSQTAIIGTQVLLAVDVQGEPPFGYRWTFNGTNITEAVGPFYEIPSVAFTNAGNYQVAINSSSGSVTSQVAVLKVVERPNVAPSVSITSPANGTRFFGPKNLTLSASASDLDGQVVRVDFFAGATPLGSATKFPFSIVVSNVPPGIYSISASATDDRGAVGTSSAVTVSGAAGGPATPGQPNSSFNPFVGPNGAVFTAIPRGTGWIIGGAFTTYDETERGRIAQLKADGSLDTAFLPGSGADNSIFSLVAQKDGAVLIGGAFSQVQGSSRAGVARLLASGALDPFFNVGSGANNAVYVVALQADQKILVGGAFTVFNGQRRNGLVRLNADGSVDPTFDANAGVSGGILTRISSIAIDAAGNILVAGDFNEASGNARSRVARFTSTGALDAAFNPGIGPNNQVQALAVQQDGKILIGGSFTEVSGQAAGGVARLTTTGAFDPSFAVGSGADGSVNSLTLQSDGRVIVSGGFSRFGGQPRAGLARLAANGAVDPQYDVGSGVAGGFVPRVNTVARTSDGATLIGGDFRQINGFNMSYVARLHGDADSVVVVPSSASFTSISVGAGGFVELTLSGKAGQSYVLQSSVDLATWISLKTNTAPADVFIVTDPAAVAPTKFYRVLSR